MLAAEMQESRLTVEAPLPPPPSCIGELLSIEIFWSFRIFFIFVTSFDRRFLLLQSSGLVNSMRPLHSLWRRPSSIHFLF